MNQLEILLLDVIGGELYAKLQMTPQASRWHAEGCVLNHVLLVMEQVAKADFENNETYQTMMACAIFHDLGKIDATKNVDGKITSVNHEGYAYNYLCRLADKLAEYFPAVSSEVVLTICQQHMRAHLYIDGKMSNPNKRKAFEADPLYPLIMMFAGFDEKGRIPGVA